MKYKQVAAQYKQELEQLKQAHAHEIQRLTETINALQRTLAAAGRKPSSESKHVPPGTPPPDFEDTSLTLPQARPGIVRLVGCSVGRQASAHGAEDGWGMRELVQESAVGML